MSFAVIFPGQGVQTPAMGAPWRASGAWEVVTRAEDALGEPLAPLLLEAPEEALARTREAQLAVLLASLLAWQAVRDHIPAPAAFAGHSLGQLTALVAAGALTVEDGVRLAAHRGECTQAAADRHPGRMAAVLGITPEQADDACAASAATSSPAASDPAAGRSCWVANDNAPGQVVLSGTPAGLEAAAEEARRRGARRVQPLNVAGAFHTPLMAEARPVFAAHLDATPFASPAAPVVSNGDARPYADADAWRERLAEHLVSPVRWRSSMETLTELGADSFVEVGPGRVLTGLARRTVPDISLHAVGAPDDVPILVEVFQPVGRTQ